jgi:hypothetical protein
MAVIKGVLGQKTRNAFVFYYLIYTFAVLLNFAKCVN